jgi:NAD(P)H-dependent FMN reductase
LTGSLRKGSTNRGIVESLSYIKSQKYFENIFFHIPDLSILPLYNFDLVREGSNNIFI